MEFFFVKRMDELLPLVLTEMPEKFGKAPRSPPVIVTPPTTPPTQTPPAERYRRDADAAETTRTARPSRIWLRPDRSSSVLLAPRGRTRAASKARPPIAADLMHSPTASR